MLIDPEYLSEIKMHLPRNYSRILQKIILEKHNLEYSPGYILMVLSVNSERTNEIIIDEAIKLAEAQKKKLSKFEKRVHKLNQSP